MLFILTTLCVLLLAFAAFGLRLLLRRRRLLQRLRNATPHSTSASQVAFSVPPFARRHRLLPLIFGILVAQISYLGGVPILFIIVLIFFVVMLVTQIDRALFEWRCTRIDEQLADAIDLMIGTLQAGGSLPMALEVALNECSHPLRPCLAEVVGRLRLGSPPREVFATLERRVPREGFRLFCSALTVHGDSGGSLTPALATVGRTLRDNMDLGRRVRGLTTHARVSTLAVLLTTYFIALVMWRNDPDRMIRFLATSAGKALAAGAMILQMLGIAWTSAMTRLRA